ncbi:MAG: ATP-binding protein [Hyphomicrobiales bacterium]|nr:ATP-binding protein [Hyphomicrobiales bacterium]MDE2115079.1 ATP-binding protein [Hyphomicrobiales bacterium]
MDNRSAGTYLIPRRARALVETALEDTRVVLIAGPRQAGKTTLARACAGPDRLYLNLDDTATLKAAKDDPVSFIRGVDKIVIDEIQRAPELILAIKEVVDRDQRPGRFLLTGSANLATLPAVADSLAGRLEVIPLLPLAQTEIRQTPGRFVDWLFSNPTITQVSDAIVGANLIDVVLRGGYPEALARKSAARRNAWFDAYITLVLDRDVRDIANIDQLDRMPRLVKVLAEHAGQLVNYTAIGGALGLSHVTTQRYVGILERLFLIRNIAPWSSNRLSRLIKTPKSLFLDSGLLAALRGADAGEIQADRTRFGPLLESFVVAEVLKLLSWSGQNYHLSHFRTREGEEVDLVLEDRRGRIVGIEVKASAVLRPKDLNGLRKLQEAAGDKFVHGIVLHDHDRMTPFTEKLSSGPISLLWSL